MFYIQSSILYHPPRKHRNQIEKKLKNEKQKTKAKVKKNYAKMQKRKTIIKCNFKNLNFHTLFEAQKCWKVFLFNDY